MFYDKKIEIYSRTASKNSIGQTVNNSPDYIKDMMVDIQPFTKEEAKKEYGFDIECTEKMFCDISDININSTVIKYKNKSYDVKKVIEWDDYMEVLINEI